MSTYITIYKSLKFDNQLFKNMNPCPCGNSLFLRIFVYTSVNEIYKTFQIV